MITFSGNNNNSEVCTYLYFNQVFENSQLIQPLYEIGISVTFMVIYKQVYTSLLYKSMYYNNNMKIKKINLNIILFIFVIFPTWRCAKRIRNKRMKCDRRQSKHQWKHIEMYLLSHWKHWRQYWNAYPILLKTVTATNTYMYFLVIWNIVWLLIPVRQ